MLEGKQLPNQVHTHGGMKAKLTLQVDGIQLLEDIVVDLRLCRSLLKDEISAKEWADRETKYSKLTTAEALARGTSILRTYMVGRDNITMLVRADNEYKTAVDNLKSSVREAK